MGEVTTERLIAMTIGILAVVLTAKWIRAYVRRRKLNEKKKKLEENGGVVESDEDEVRSAAKLQLKELAEKLYVGACDKVIPEEYEYQSSIGTKRAVNGLTNSSSYQAMLRKKGDEVEGWNW